MKLKYEASLESMDKLTADYEDIKRKFGYTDEEKKQLLENIKHKEVRAKGD
jgi:predicted nuclease with TOPRIM domain